MFEKTDLAYAAGYIDGDGCFYIGTYETSNETIYEYSIQVCSVKKGSTDWLKKTFGGNIRIKEAPGNRKVPHVWTIKGEESLKFAKAIHPYLAEKQMECSIYIEFAWTIISNNFQPLTSEGVIDRIALIKNMRHERHFNNLICKDSFYGMKNISISPSITPDDNEIAYMAGLIDAEGCFRVKKWKVKNKPNPVYAICLEIGNTKRCIFEWILLRFGGSITYCASKADNRRNSIIWNLSAKKLNFFLPRINSFIKIKQPVCEKIIEFYKTNLSNGGDRHSEIFKKRYQTVLATREKIVSEIHILNKKGHF